MTPPGHRSLLAALLTVAAGVAVLTATTAAYRPLPYLAYDSRSFVEWHPGRPIGYPAFLTIIGAVSPDLSLAGPLQLALFLGAAVWLAVSVHRVVRCAPAALAFGVATMANPQVAGYALTLLPESLFMSAVMIHVASVMRLMGAEAPPISNAVAAGLTAGLAILLKPAAYSLLLCLAALPVLLHRRARRVMGWVLAPVAVLWLTGSAWNYARLGVFATQAYGGYNLAGHVAIFIEPTAGARHPELARRIAARLAGVRRDLSQIPSLEHYALIWAIQFHHTLAGVLVPEIAAAVDSETPGLAENDRFVRLNAISGELANDAIRAHPLGYARHVFANVLALWTMPNLMNRATAAAFEAEHERLLARLPSLAHDAVARRDLPPVAYWAMRIVLVAIVIASFAWLASVSLRRDAPARALAYAALVLQSNFLLVAAVQPGLPRYALAMWPMSMLLLFGTAAALWSGRRERTGPAISGQRADA